MRSIRRDVVLASVILLTACGGDSGSGTTSQAPPVVSPSPTPTPLPTPTYLSARDFSMNRSSGGFGVRFETFAPYGQPVQQKRTLDLSLASGSADAAFTYTANPQKYELSFLREVGTFTNIRPYEVASVVGDQDYDPASPSPIRRLFRVVEKESVSAIFSYEYVGYVSWTQTDTNYTVAGQQGDRDLSRLFLYGAKTLENDLPKNGTSLFRVPVSVVGNYELEFAINWADGSITGNTKYICIGNRSCSTQTVTGSEIRMTGRFDGSGRFTGAITGTLGYSGDFTGAFYGPQARELGLVAVIRNGVSNDAAIVTFGNRN
jgi:hypothetical protein